MDIVVLLPNIIFYIYLSNFRNRKTLNYDYCKYMIKIIRKVMHIKM